jgi:CRP/FNR family transcriptional regulator, cyclic AMP receptor protein
LKSRDFVLKWLRGQCLSLFENPNEAYRRYDMWITESGLFEGVSQQSINGIAAESVIESHEKDSTIFEAGEEANYLYILIEGAMQVSAGSRQKCDFTVNQPGGVVGLSSLLEPFRYNTRVSAKTPIQVVKMPREAIERVLKTSPEDGVLMLRHLMAVMGQRLIDAYEYII